MLHGVSMGRSGMRQRGLSIHHSVWDTNLSPREIHLMLLLLRAVLGGSGSGQDVKVERVNLNLRVAVLLQLQNWGL